MLIRLVAGLGNPGKRYERDRHNVGFQFLSRLADQHRVTLKSEPRFRGLTGRLALPSGDIWLAMPQTYMNESGACVGALARFYKIAPEQCLVVHDELDFAPGVAKLKEGGGVAGHNGLKDIAEHFGSQHFWRLRIGIGHPGDRNVVADYVLSKPAPEERELIEQALEKSLDVSSLMLQGDMRAAMLKLHTKA